MWLGGSVRVGRGSRSSGYTSPGPEKLFLWPLVEKGFNSGPVEPLALLLFSPVFLSFIVPLR